MKSYLGLVPLSAKKRKKRNRMTLLCIIIAVFMVTGIFSMADVAVKMERTHASGKHGNWHFQVENVSEDKLFEIADESFVKYFSRYDTVNNNLDEEYYINKKSAVISCCDEDYLKMMSTFEEGSYPSCSNEIILNESMKEIMGVKKGDIVKVSTPCDEREMVISGFVDENIDMYDACRAFVTVEAFWEITNGLEVEEVGYYQLENNYTAKKNIEKIKSLHKISEDEITRNEMLLMAYGNSEDNYIVGIYYIAAVLIVFVILAGVLMISGSISASVSERISFYGMLRCIGASKKQILKLVRLEALNWCKTAVPVGAALGTIGAWGLTAVLRTISSEFADLKLFYISPIGIIMGVVSGIVTVWIASALPARKASKASPIAAASGNMNVEGKKSGIRKLSDKADIKLGMKYALDSKKSVFMISGSFALCIVVCLVFVSMLQLIERALPCLRDYSADIEVYAPNYSSSLDVEIADELNSMPEVKHAFGRMYSQVEVESNKSVDVIDLISYDELQFGWAKKDLIKGDVDKVSKESGYVLTVYDKENPLRVGDVVYIEGQPYEIGAALNNSPFSSSDIPTVICSEETFEELFGKSKYATIDIQMADEFFDSNQNVIRDIFDDDVIISDRREDNKETTSIYYAFNITVYAFISLLALISIINIVNSISMSTQARTKQLGIMRAIGLDDDELGRMIFSQGATYAITGIIIGMAVGIPLHCISYNMLITSHFGDEWSLPIAAIVAILSVVLAATVISVILPVKRIKKTSITEVIKEL